MTQQFTRRFFIKSIVATCLLSSHRIGLAAALTQIVAIRIWPSSTYTRITLESNLPLQYKQFKLSAPSRLVLDIDDLHLNSTLKSLTTKIKSSDPFIKHIRVAERADGKVRVVIELKQATNPNIFNLQPIAEFKYRFVVDLYHVEDRHKKDEASLVALLSQFNKGKIEEIKPVKSTPPKKASTFVVMLDPGHGGEDPGAIGYRKVKEKDVVLQIARRLRNLFKNEKKFTVHMTRNEDIFLPLQVRVAKANAVRADLFVSIHADAFTQRTARGSSVFMLSRKGASSTAAQFLAKTQNEADEIGGVSRRGDRYVDHTLLDLVQTSTLTNSRILGNAILKYVKKVNNMHKNSIEQAGFAVLKAPNIPSVLVETAFISNLEEERKLTTVKFQNQLAQAMFEGIKEYSRTRKV